MKINLIKITLLGLIVLAISSCNNAKNDKQIDPLAGTAVDPLAGTLLPDPKDVPDMPRATDDCSWCDKTLTGTFEVYLSDVKGKTKFVYATSGPLGRIREIEPSKKIENPYYGLSFCSLKCLNEFASSKLVINKYEFDSENRLYQEVHRLPDPEDVVPIK